MRKSYLVILFCLVSLCSLASEPLKIGLFNGQSFSRAGITIVKGTISVYADGEMIGQLNSGGHADISSIGAGVSIVFNGSTKSGFKKITLDGGAFSQFKIQPVGSKANTRIYEGKLIAVQAPSRLQLIGLLPVEKYVSGVIEAEGGSNHHIEYYKVQAIISRTYACANLRRHEAEGFSVCDGTHCQVYHGIARHTPDAVVATQETEDMVIVDHNIDLITAAFHSNCGGHTVNAEDVWSKPLSYCVGRADTFCLVMPHSNWEKSVPKNQWTDYLESKRYPLTDSSYTSALAYFPSEKQTYFVDSTLKIPTKLIRQDFKLKSAYFTVHQHGEDVTFIGQGFGHGVGLCQEGAMRMATLGYPYSEIIHFYYKDVHLIPLRFISFFKEDVP